MKLEIRDQIPPGTLVPLVVILHALHDLGPRMKWRIASITALGDPSALVGKGMLEFEEECRSRSFDISWPNLARLALLLNDIHDLVLVGESSELNGLRLSCVDSSVWEIESDSVEMVSALRRHFFNCSLD